MIGQALRSSFVFRGVEQQRLHEAIFLLFTYNIVLHRWSANDYDGSLHD